MERILLERILRERILLERILLERILLERILLERILLERILLERILRVVENELTTIVKYAPLNRMIVAAGQDRDRRGGHQMTSKYAPNLFLSPRIVMG